MSTVVGRGGRGGAGAGGNGHDAKGGGPANREPANVMALNP